MTSKICIKCALTKHLDEYRKGRNSCKACEAATLKEWRSANKEKMEASRKVWSYVNKDSVTDHVREKNRKRKRDLLDGGICELCGLDNAELLEFAHRDRSTKKFNVSDRVGGEIASLRHEVSKCKVLCGNCHCIETHKENTSYKHIFATTGVTPEDWHGHEWLETEVFCFELSFDACMCSMRKF